MSSIVRRLLVTLMVTGVAVAGVAASTAPAHAIPPAEATAASRPDVGVLPTLSPDDRSREVPQPRATSAGVQPLVAKEECLTVSGEHVTALRYASEDRYETAVCASFWTWGDHDNPRLSPRAQAVVLARGDAFADALAGGPLAGYAEGPLLLTRPASLPSFVLGEIHRVLPPGGLVYLLGSTAAISDAVQSQLESAGFTTRRLAGDNRYETALAVAEELPDTSNFFFATGGDFPDALGAATAAAGLSREAKLDDDPETRPFALLLTADEVMLPEVSDFVNARGAQFGVWTLATAGAPADQAAVAAFGAESLAARFVGANRYATAAQIAQAVYTDDTGQLVVPGVGLATGTNFPDALAATATLAVLAEPLLLTNPTQLSTPTRSFLHGQVVAPGEAFLDVFGGQPAVSDAVVLQAELALTAD